MSDVQRRKGKPNRGGGKFNRRGGGRGRGGVGKHGGGGGGGSGGGGGRKGNMDMDYDDDFSLDGAWGSKPPAPSGAPSRYGRGGGSARGGSARGGSARGGSTRGGSARGGSARGSRGGGISGTGRPMSGPTRGFGSARGVRGRGAVTREVKSDRPKMSGPVAKVPMQRLFMSTENQDMVRDMLRDLHGADQEFDDIGEDTEEDEDDHYEEVDVRMEDQYWMTDHQLCVEAAETNVAPAEDSEVFTEEHVSKVAVNKLMRYGFDRERSLTTLVKTEGDIGQALEILLNDCFDLGLHVKLSQPQASNQNRDFKAEGDEDNDIEEEKPNPKLLKITDEEVAEQRAEEILVLQSIYGNAFSERLPGRVWVLGLNIPHLDALSEATAGMRSIGGTQWKVPLVDDRDVCRFYLRGSCKFGANRCRYKHESPFVTKEEPESYKAANPDDETYTYELEIRFPLENKYPFEPPVIAFSTRNKDMPYNICLNITRRLYVEARDLAESEAPVVFPLASLFDNEDDLTRLFGEPPMRFSNPPPIVSRRAAPAPAPPIEVVKNDQFRNKEKKEKEKEAPVVDYVNNSSEEDEMDPKEREESMRQKYARGRKAMMPRALTRHEQQRVDSRLVEQFKRKQKEPAYKKMQEKRQELPAWYKQDDVLAAVAQAQVVVISGMTGCGKSTQVPQYILDASLQGSHARPANIVCTQPRRISAMAVAERVADERAEKCGGSVGYQIRLETCMSSRTRLLFCTTGILLRRLEGDGNLSDVTHVILDEVHERTEESDFLLMVLRDLIYERRDLKLILMSATLNASLFSEYFTDCPVVEIPGRTFPVEQYFLEDSIEFTRYTLEDRSPYARSMKTSNAHPGQGKGGRGGAGGGRQIMEDVEDELKRLSISADLQPAKDNVQDQNLQLRQLYVRYSDYNRSTIKALATMDFEKINYELIESLLEWIVYGNHEYPEGAILVFLPGLQEITTLYEQLLSSSTFGGRNKQKFKLIPLHSTLSSEDQHAVFSRPREGVTKIVISTNIAETSITIDDVVYVIDAGRMKEKRYDSDKGMESLESVWVSRANAMQRRGRAGRVASGVCFHMFTGHRFEHHLRDQPIPEIQRAPLESIVLRIKVLDIFFGYRVEDVLNKLIEPPPETSVSNAVKRLQDLGALDLDCYLTPLGYHLAALPVDVRIGKLMLFGSIFRCLDSALTIAAMLSFKSPFVSPFDKRDEADKKKLEFATCNSDHLTMLKAYMGWVEAQRQGGRSGYLYCMDNFLSIKTMQMLASMKRQFVELLSDIGFIQEGLTTRKIERNFRDGDGVIDATGREANTNNNNMKLVAAMLVGALFPNVVQVMTPENKYMQSGVGAIPKAPRPEDLKFKTKMDGYVNIHPSSVNFQVRHYDSPYLVYHEKVKTSKVYIRDCTMVSVYPLLLFGGSITIDLDRGEFILSVDDGWIRFLATSQFVAELVRELRLELDQLLQDKIETPNMDLRTCPRGSRIIDTIVRLVTTQ